MISVTEQKPFEEITQYLDKCRSVYIIGCGTCTTYCHTGGKDEVVAMKAKLEDAGKKVTGWMVIPTACNELTRDALRENAEDITAADCILAMPCAFGVQTIARQLRKFVVPGLDTMFIGKEIGVGRFDEICTQCGTCIIGETGGICPVTSCHKGLVNGPCGGTNNGKCEIDADKDCAWTLIYNRLEELDRLDSMRRYQRPRNHQGEPTPGKYVLEEKN